MESEYYSAVGSACQGLFMKAVIEFMSRSPCDLILYVDNQSCKAFCLRQGVTKASKYFEGRLLWLQDAVQQKRLIMKYVATHANLGDLHIKPLAPARLQTLLHLHDFVDTHGRPIGAEEWDRAATSAAIKAQVKREARCDAFDDDASSCRSKLSYSYEANYIYLGCSLRIHVRVSVCCGKHNGERPRSRQRRMDFHPQA